MRIIAGKLRGKIIKAPEGDGTRPTSDRARESLFNILNSQLMKSGKNWADIFFVDLFAGSGAIGIEALSRGAKEVVLVECDKKAIRVIRENSQGLKNIIVSETAACQMKLNEVPDIVFMDPPYGKGLWQKVLTEWSSDWLSEKTLIVVETDKNLAESVPAGFRVLMSRNAGRNLFLFLKKGEKNG